MQAKCMHLYVRLQWCIIKHFTGQQAGWALLSKGADFILFLHCFLFRSKHGVTDVQALMSEDAELPAGLQDWRAPDGYSVYAAGGAANADTPRTLVWQSYLKEGGKSGGCS